MRLIQKTGAYLERGLSRLDIIRHHNRIRAFNPSLDLLKHRLARIKRNAVPQPDPNLVVHRHSQIIRYVVFTDVDYTFARIFVGRCALFRAPR